MVVAALVGQVVVLVTVHTWLQEVSFRWMGLAGVGLPTAAALAAVATLAAVVAAVLGPQRRRRTVLLVGAMTVAWGVVVVLGAPTLRGIVAPRPAGDGAEMTLLSQNLWYQNDDPDRTARAVMARDADVMVLVEYTPAHAEAFRAAGVRDAYRYRWEEPGERGGGLAVMSRFAFGDIARLRTWSGAVRLDLDVDGAPLTLYGVHPVAPSDRYGLRRWKGDYRTLTGVLRDAGPTTVVAGDFNATGGHRRFRELMSVAGAAGRAGRRRVPASAPPGRPAASLPPVMRLDHVLVGPGIGVERAEILDDVGVGPPGGRGPAPRSPGRRLAGMAVTERSTPQYRPDALPPMDVAGRVDRLRPAARRRRLRRVGGRRT